MANSILIKGATIVNEGAIYVADVLIENDMITKIDNNIDAQSEKILDGKGKYLLPGVIDTHVHFREPGLAHKGDIKTESAAAIAGGVTSFFDMPNTTPNTIDRNTLKSKYDIAAIRSFANYGFYLGVGPDSLSAFRSEKDIVPCGVTDDGLYITNTKSLLVDRPNLLKELLDKSHKIVSIHSEDEELIESNLRIAMSLYGTNIPAYLHPVIRSQEACYTSTKKAISIASKSLGRLHILHLSTEMEAKLLEANADVTQKRITGEVCVHHLWFNDKYYKMLGNKIKWNPAIKTEQDRIALLDAVNDDRIDIISSDHAPHLMHEKNVPYNECPSGAPMVQHSLLIMLELVSQGKVTITKVVDKMCHNPARMFGIFKRGFIRQGYKADLVLIDTCSPTVVDQSNILYKCGWSPLEGARFSSSIHATIINGIVSYSNGQIQSTPCGEKLSFKTPI